MAKKIQYNDIVDVGIPTKMNEFFKQVERVIARSYTNIDKQAKKIKRSLSDMTKIDSKSIGTLKNAEAQTDKLKNAKQNLTAKEKEYLNIKKQIQSQLEQLQSFYNKDTESLNEKVFKNQKDKLVNELIDLSKSLKNEFKGYS